jgi:hypothetical protein
MIIGTTVLDNRENGALGSECGLSGGGDGPGTSMCFRGRKEFASRVVARVSIKHIALADGVAQP